MTVLVVNLGTSDLLVSIDGYYLPIGFDRNEKNVNYENITDAELQIWNDRDKLIASKLCPELSIEPKKIIRNKDDEIIAYTFDFRKLTKRIWEEYQENTSFWEKRLSPGRIGGVIEEAQNKFEVQKAYIFVTDQSTEKKPDYHDGDTCYLFKILNKIMGENIKLIPRLIKENAIDADSLLETYYDFFNKNISDNETVLVSIKGGTPQMQTALKMQAIASSIPHLLFVDPQLNISKAQKGESSECIITSYWRYLKTQKYQTVKLLLNSRWDFDGAIQILKDWQRYLKFLIKKEVIDPDIQITSEFIRLILQRLDIARNYFNLDNSWQLNYQIQPNDDLGSLQEVKNNYDKVLNLYTQCQILFDELNQVANFLFRMSSFCEEILHEIIKKLDGEKYFNKASYPDDWFLVRQQNLGLWQKFYNLESQFNPNNTKLNHCNAGRIPSYKLPGRYSKRNFVAVLIQFRDQNREKNAWKEIITSLEKLDYWIQLRNTLTHSAEGFSKNSMATLLNHDRNRHNRGDRDEIAIQANQACKHNEILDELTKIMENMAELLNQSDSPYVGLGEPYYIYSDVKQWVVEKLQKEGLGQ